MNQYIVNSFESDHNGIIVNYINKTVELGGPFLNQKESLSFGALSVSEWNNLFYKHLDHHLNQFGV